MSVLASGVRDRSFRTTIGGFDPDAVRTALAAAASSFEQLQADIAELREQQATAVREIDRIAELERSLLRSCVAAEEDARIRCGAARRYAARIIAAAEEEAAARLDAPARERDRIAREIDTIVARQRATAATLEQLIANLQMAPEPEAHHEAESVEVEIEATSGPAVGRATDDLAAAASASAAISSAASEAMSRVGAISSDTGDSGAAAARSTATRGSAGGRGAPRRSDPNAAGTDAGAHDHAADTVPRDGPLVHPLASGHSTRFRLPLAAGSAAALLLVLQGPAGLPRFGRTTPGIAAASFVPAPTMSTLPAPPGGHEANAPASTNTAATPEGPATAPPVAAAAAPLTIHIKPLRTCWVRVVVDDRTDARELQPGEDIVLHARRTIVLRAGDAAALSVEVNGRVLPPMGLTGQVVERRFTAATAD